MLRDITLDSTTRLIPFFTGWIHEQNSLELLYTL